MPDAAHALLRVEGLRVAFGGLEAVRGVDFSLAAGRVLCLVGESGCGKSVTARAVMRLNEPAGRVTAGRILWQPDPAAPALDLAALPAKGNAVRAVRGPGIGMIFQEPMAALVSLAHPRGPRLTLAVRWRAKGRRAHVSLAHPRGPRLALAVRWRAKGRRALGRLSPWLSLCLRPPFH